MCPTSADVHRGERAGHQPGLSPASTHVRGRWPSRSARPAAAAPGAPRARPGQPVRRTPTARRAPPGRTYGPGPGQLQLQRRHPCGRPAGRHRPVRDLRVVLGVGPGSCHSAVRVGCPERSNPWSSCFISSSRWALSLSLPRCMTPLQHRSWPLAYPSTRERHGRSPSPATRPSGRTGLMTAVAVIIPLPMPGVDRRPAATRRRCCPRRADRPAGTDRIDPPDR